MIKSEADHWLGNNSGNILGANNVDGKLFLREQDEDARTSIGQVNVLDRMRVLKKEHGLKERTDQAGGNVFQDVVSQYKVLMAKLVSNSKPVITNLTIIAGENSHAAKGISGALCDHILRVGKEQKLPLLYLLDSIVKNIAGEYVRYFSARVAEVFCNCYRQMDSGAHRSMEHLYRTWRGVFPDSVMGLIESELKIPLSQKTSAAKAGTQACQEKSIHVNAKYVHAFRQKASQDDNRPPDMEQSEMTANSYCGVVRSEMPTKSYCDDAVQPPVLEPCFGATAAAAATLSGTHDPRPPHFGLGFPLVADPRRGNLMYNAQVQSLLLLHQQRQLNLRHHMMREFYGLPSPCFTKSALHSNQTFGVVNGVKFQHLNNYSQPQQGHESAYSQSPYSLSCKGEVAISEGHSQKALQSQVENERGPRQEDMQFSLETDKFSFGNITNDVMLASCSFPQVPTNTTLPTTCLSSSCIPQQTYVYNFRSSPQAYPLSQNLSMASIESDSLHPSMQHASSTQAMHLNTSPLHITMQEKEDNSPTCPLPSNDLTSLLSSQEGSSLSSLLSTLVAHGLISAPSVPQNASNNNALSDASNDSASSVFPNSSVSLKRKAEEDCDECLHKRNASGKLEQDYAETCVEINDPEKHAIQNSMDQALLTNLAPVAADVQIATVPVNKGHAMLAVPADETQSACTFCGEPFEDFYNEKTQEWMYGGTVYANFPSGNYPEGADASILGPIVHAGCRAEGIV